MNKNGSLNLSIQAIVILVMAMAVLGLGLGFIRTLMSQGQDQFEDAIGSVELSNPPSSADPFTVDGNINVDSPTTKQTSFNVGVYNDGEFDATEVVSLSLGTCSPPKPDGGWEIRSVGQKIPEGSYASYRVLLPGPGTGDLYVCELKASDGNGEKVKQIQININS
ncbi:hypothetical protein ACFLTH_05545 [Bacteroidota bacterium]